MAIYQIKGVKPNIHESAFVADEATVIGGASIGARTSVWPGAVIRADNDAIVVGDESNIQEGAVLHVDAGKPLVIGRGVTVGHQAMLHGCTVGDGSLIGIQAVVLNGAVIGKNCLVAAGALVTENKVFSDGSLIMGSPAKAVRDLTPEAIEGLAASAATYVEHTANYLRGLERVD